MGKPKRGRNAKATGEADEDIAVDSVDQTQDLNEDTGGKAKGGKKKGKKDKKNKDWDVDDIVNEIEGLKVNDNKETNGGDEPAPKSKKDKKKKGKKKDFDEDELLDDIAALADEGDTKESNETEEPEVLAPTSKKDKKKKGKKKDFDEDELIEDIASIEGEAEEEPVAMSKKDKKKNKKKGKKQDFDEDDLLDELAEMQAEMDGGKKTKKEDTVEEKEEKQKATSKPEEEEGGEMESGGVKTAAQKKAEKKEREKKKKEAQRQEARNRKLKQQAKSKDEPEGDEGAAKTEAAAEKLEAEDKSKEKEDGGEDEGEVEEEAGDKKKKKKKKKGKGEETVKKSGLGKSKLKAMQEALQKMKEEEERLKAEEEAKIKAAEEAENLRLEKLHKDKEKKEREKQKKKERIERQKREGTYMTKAQKEAKARAAAMLEAMRKQGIEVPAVPASGGPAEAGPKKVRYGTRSKKNKKGQDPGSPEAQMETESVVSETVDAEDNSITEDGTEDKSETGSAEEEKKEEEKKEEVKESWELSSEEEEEEEEKEEEPTEDAVPKKEITVQPKKDEDAEDDEDEDDEDESSEEESDSDEEESDSDEESSSDEDDKTPAEKIRERAITRIKKRREDAEAKRTTDELRCPVVCVLGHVDTGKTKILDKIRHTNVQDGEAGGITQQIGATRVPDETIKEQTKMCRQFAKAELKIPGLLIIDTPGHESFSNLRSRGSSLCDIAILVVDIMHGLEPQTIESLNLLKSRKTPFIVALNKIDRLFEWKAGPHTDVANVIKKQKINTKDEFDERLQGIVTEFAEQGMNAAPFYNNPDPKSYVSLVPTSAHSGDGMGNLIALIVELSQTMLAKRLSYSENLECTTLEVKALPGLGTTIDVVLVNGKIKEGDTMVLAGQEGPIVTPVRGLLMPQPLRELRVKNAYEKYKELKAAQGIKILAKDLDKALAGMPLLIAQHPDEVELLKEEVAAILKDALKSIKLTERGVFVQASTLGSLEALLEFLKTSKIPYAGINIGPVHKRDVMKASVMLEHDNQYAVILAFDVRVEREAQEMADREGIKVFQADIIYHLFDSFMAHREELRLKKREEFKHIAVFPCKLKILPSCIFNARNPIVMGVSVEGGIVKEGTPICIPSRENLSIGVIGSLEVNHKQVETARKGQEVCIKIEHVGGDAPKMFGRHFDQEDILVSKISRESIDAVKNYFREDLEKADWQVMIELKKILEIL